MGSKEMTLTMTLWEGQGQGRQGTEFREEGAAGSSALEARWEVQHESESYRENTARSGSPLAGRGHWGTC